MNCGWTADQTLYQHTRSEIVEITKAMREMYFSDVKTPSEDPRNESRDPIKDVEKELLRSKIPIVDKR